MRTNIELEDGIILTEDTTVSINGIKRWANAVDEWQWSKDFKCYIYIPDWAPFNTPPHNFCLGDRMVYWAPGQDTEKANLRGSTLDDWNGYSFGYNLAEAIHWIGNANNKDLKCYLWGDVL